MKLQILLDEQTDTKLQSILKNYGHNTKHILNIENLGKGSTDKEIAKYSKNNNRIILTYDNDFILNIQKTEYFGVLYNDKSELPPYKIACIIDTMSKYYQLKDFKGINYLDKKWLNYK